MAYREFVDADGREWRAWDTRPQKTGMVAPGFEDGWISFERDGEKCRLAPIPPGWDEAPELRLRALLRQAQTRGGGRPGGPPPPG